VPTRNSGYGVNGAYPGNGAYAGSGAYASDGAYGPDGSYGSYGAYGAYGASEANEGTGAGTGAFQQPYGADGSGLPVPSFSPSGYPGGPPDLGAAMGDGGGYPGYGGYPEPTPPQAPAAPRAPEAWQGPGGPQGSGAWQGPGGSQGSGAWQGPRVPQGTGGWQGQGGVPGGGSDIRISGPMRLRNAAGGTGAAGATSAPGAGRGRHGSGEVPVVTDVPVTRPGAPEGPPFDVFTPLHRSEQGGAAAPGTGDAPYAQSYADPRTGTSNPQPSYGPGPGPGYGQPAAGQPAYGDGNIHGDGPGVQQAGPGGSGDTDYKGLPRRVRQASLAPQLRSSTAASTETTSAGVPPAASASLSDMRNTLSAMQRGWQQGRSQGQQDTEGSGDGD
jgi:hypothetical protein